MEVTIVVRYENTWSASLPTGVSVSLPTPKGRKG